MDENNFFLDKVVLVTGSSQGIGLETARQFSKQGAKVILVARDSEKLEQARDSIAGNEKVYAWACDLSVENDIDGLFDFIETEFRRLDILINNLGAFSEKLAWNEISHETWIKAFETNVLSAYACMTRAASMMIRSGIKGSIVNIGSSAALQLKKGRAQYTVTKSALHTLSRVAALDLAKYQIRVNVVSPGPTATEVVQKRMSDPELSKAEEERMQKIPLGRYASPADIANAAVFLCSPSASFITGVILPVDGGYTVGETV